MNRILKSAALAVLALSFVAPSAYAAKVKAPTVEQTQTAPKQPTYEQKHEAGAAALGQLRDALKAMPVDQLNAEIAKLATFQKAFIDAKGKNDEVAAKAASDGYADSVNSIIKLNMQIGQTIQSGQGLSMQLGMMLGADGEKFSKEADVVAIQAELEKLVNAAMAAAKASNDAVGALYKQVSASAAARLQLERQKIIDEELHNQVNNLLQQKLAE